jgi:hypothetical protein
MPRIACLRLSCQSTTRRSYDATLQSTSNIAAAMTRSASGHPAVWAATAPSSALRRRWPASVTGSSGGRGLRGYEETCSKIRAAASATGSQRKVSGHPILLSQVRLAHPKNSESDSESFPPLAIKSRLNTRCAARGSG